MDLENNGNLAHHVHSAWCLLVSTAVLVLTVILTSSLRSVIRSRSKETLTSLSLLDFLCGLELCMCGFELGVILDIYDTPVYCIYLWIVLVWQGLAWGGATPSPHTHLVNWWAGQQSLLVTGARTIAGASGALSSFTLMSILWTYDMSHFHEDREKQTSAGHCGDDLQVSLTMGMMIEMAGSLVCFLSASIMSDIPQLSSKPLLSLSLDSVLGVGLVMAGFDLTGGYYSPALALGTKLGCGEAGHAQHLAVYWAAPCVGALLADPLYQTTKYIIHNLSGQSKKNV